MSKEPIDLELSRQQLETELKRVQIRKRRTNTFKSTVMWMLIVIVLMLTVSALWFPILWIEDGASTSSVSGRGLLAMKTGAFYAEDLVACNLGSDAVIMRVIAVAGDPIDYDDEGHILINGNPHVATAQLDHFSSVPKECVLLIEHSGEEIHCVRSDQVIGKVLLQFWPLPWIENQQ